MTGESYRFDAFLFEPDDRRLLKGGSPVDLNARYLDALALLVREQGRMVSKDRFMAEVWHGVPVTDEALTQCVRTLRRLLGDDAVRPSFIETVPKHGYRFIAAVETAVAPPAPTAASPLIQDILLTGGTGTAGAALAGAIGGLLYGLAAATQPPATSGNALSLLLVLFALTTALAAIGGAGVSFGIAAAQYAPAQRAMWAIVGGAAGGFLIGAITKLVGLDAFSLLLGQSPGDFTGAAEGALLGGTVGIALWAARRTARWPFARRVALAALVGATGGASISLLGGRLFGGSLALLERRFPGSRLDLDAIGALFGERGIGAAGELATAMLEAALFAACIVGAIIAAEKN